MEEDFESDRQGALAEAREGLAEGETLESLFGPGTFGDHELLDRASILGDNWESFIASHPATLLDPERYRKAREIAEAMADFYQLVGRGDETDVARGSTAEAQSRSDGKAQ